MVALVVCSLIPSLLVDVCSQTFVSSITSYKKISNLDLHYESNVSLCVPSNYKLENVKIYKVTRI